MMKIITSCQIKTYHIFPQRPLKKVIEGVTQKQNLYYLLAMKNEKENGHCKGQYVQLITIIILVAIKLKVELTDKTVTSNFKDLGLIVVQRGVLNLSKNQKRCMKWAEYQPLNPLFHLHLLMYKSIVAKKDMEEPIHTVFPSEVILDR